MEENSKQEEVVAPVVARASSLKERIKNMEKKRRVEAAPIKETPLKISFDSWFHFRKGGIPAHHPKEVILAYFKSQGLSMLETIERYDIELKRYGI